MKKLMLAAAAAVALAGCTPGAGGKTSMVDSCVKDGTDKKVCTCMVDEMEKNLDKKVWSAMVKAAAKDDSNAMDSLPPEQAMAAVPVMMGAAMKCGVN